MNILHTDSVFLRVLWSPFGQTCGHLFTLKDRIRAPNKTQKQLEQ